MSSKLRLGPIPKMETVKMTITVPLALKSDLDRYAELHSKTWGTPVDAATLIPHILATFILRDRAFRSNL
jgi:hypothetical protein